MYLIETETESWEADGWCWANSMGGFVVGIGRKTFRFDDIEDAKRCSAFLQEENIVHVFHGLVTEH